MSVRMGIDFAYDRMSVCVGKDIWHIPACAAFETKTRRVCAYGEEAVQTAARIPGKYICQSALQLGGAAAAGVLSDTLRSMLGDRIFRRPELYVCLPPWELPGIRQQLTAAAKGVGVRSLTFFDRRLCAARGAGIDTARSCASLVVLMDDDYMGICVIRDGQIVGEKSLYVKKQFVQSAVRRYFIARHGIIVGQDATRKMKKMLSLKYAPDAKSFIEGREIGSSMKKKITISDLRAFDVFGGLYEEVAAQTQGMIRQLYRQDADDVRQRGILLVGVHASLPGLDNYIEYMTGVHCICDASANLAVTGLLA